MNIGSPLNLNSFRYAWNGCRMFFHKELNARIHALIAVGVTIAGILFGLSATEWVLQLLCIALVIGLEMINTAIEMMVDRWSPEIDETAGRVKDVAAGAVLVGSGTAAVIGCIIYGPKVWHMIIELTKAV